MGRRGGELRTGKKGDEGEMDNWKTRKRFIKMRKNFGGLGMGSEEASIWEEK